MPCKWKKTIAEIGPNLQHGGFISKTWAKQKNSLIHCDKTTCMAVGTRHRTRILPELNIVIDNNKIKRVYNQILLGIYIDENLLWTMHTEYLCTTISSKISQLKELSYYFSIDIYFPTD